MRASAFFLPENEISFSFHRIAPLDSLITQERVSCGSPRALLSRVASLVPIGRSSGSQYRYILTWSSLTQIWPLSMVKTSSYSANESRIPFLSHQNRLCFGEHNFPPLSCCWLRRATPASCTSSGSRAPVEPICAASFARCATRKSSRAALARIGARWASSHCAAWNRK